MSRFKARKRRLKSKLIHKYRLVIISEDTFEEKLSFKLSRLNLFISIGVFAITCIFLTTMLISFTPLREYIPGYSSLKLKKQASDLVYKTDSLENVLKVNNLYIDNVKQVLVGDVENIAFDLDSVYEFVTHTKVNLDIKNSEKDSLFRLEVEAQDKFSFFEEARKDVGILFFAPATGIISQNFNNQTRHFAVDVGLKPGTPIMSVADGTVIFSEWTATSGHVIIIEHSKKFTSIYKYNGALHKQQGDLVLSGEVIASSGSSSEFTSGPHLHFELWNDGYPVNPTNFIDFK